MTDVVRRASIVPTEPGVHSKPLEIEKPVDDQSRPWYKEAVFYEVYVRAFCDSNGDGIGDLPGLTSRLDYLSGLGVNCIWLLPIYPSPLKDDGYDVADYCDIHPDFGNLEDFKTLVKATHERNMRIIVDFIPNHCSDQHRWFQAARADRNSPYRDYFVWSDQPDKYKECRVIFVDTEKSNWTYDEMAGQFYWHRFYSSQPDLNYENPKVCEEMLNVMRFWLTLGIDGFRVDAVPYLFEQEGTDCENLPQTHSYLKEMRRMVDTEYPGKVLLAEACQLPNQVREYFGEEDEFHMGFHFPVMPRIFMCMKLENTLKLKKILEDTPEIPPSCQWVTFLRNHDELTLEMVTKEEREYMWKEYAPDPRMRLNVGIRRRLAPLLDNDRRKIELAYNMLLTLPGSPIIYYGDEICMGDNIWLFDRNGVRTPMQWDRRARTLLASHTFSSSLPHAGFSTAAKTYAPVIDSKEYGPHRVNVQLAMEDPSSLYNILSYMLLQRRQHPAFGFGDLKWIDQDEVAVACYIRSYGIDRVLIVANNSKSPRSVTVPLTREYVSTADRYVQDILTDAEVPITQEKDKASVHLTLKPYEFLWLTLPKF